MQNVEGKFTDNEKDFIRRKASEYNLDNPEVLNHPDYNSVLISGCLDAQRDGELDLFLDTVSFIKDNFESSDGKILISETRFKRFLEANRYGILKQAHEDSGFPKRWDSDDEFMFRYLLTYRILEAKGKDFSLSGKPRLTNDVWLTNNYIISEGMIKAYNILSEMMDYYLYRKEKMEHSIKFDNYLLQKTRIAKNTEKMLLDMNICGRQLIDACEYAGNNPQELAEILDSKIIGFDKVKNLISYINQKSAKRIEDGASIKEAIAVLSGATNSYLPASELKALSENKYIMDKSNYKKYITANVKAIVLDYRKFDILKVTNMKTAIHIAESRGFKIIKDVSFPDRFDPPKMAHSIIMYNDKTGAVITAPNARDENFCFIDCSLSFVSLDSLKTSLLNCWQKPIGKVKKTLVREYISTCNNGLFSDYDELEDKIIKLDSDAIKDNIDKHYFMCPIPQYVNFKANTHNFSDIFSDITDYIDLTDCINLLIAKNDSELVNSEMKIYKDFFNGCSFYKYLISQLAFSNPFQGLDFAFSYLHTPDKEKMEICNGLRNCLEKNKGSFLSEEKRIFFSKELDQYISSEKIMDPDQFDKLMEKLNYPKIEDLSISLPWINEVKL